MLLGMHSQNSHNQLLTKQNNPNSGIHFMVIKSHTLRLIAFFFICIPAIATSQPSSRITIQQYISMYKDDAIKDMMKMGVPASITLAQGILESESGNSDLAKEARNHFGIKCHSDWTGPGFHKDDDAKDECFRKYNSVLESFDDHSKFLRERSRYAFLFDYDITDYKAWAHGLKKAGYATNPKYADLLIKLIEEYNLHEYDKGGKKIPVVQTATPPVASNTPPKTKPSRQHHTKTPGTHKPQPASTRNDVPFVKAAEGDTWFSIAVANDMRLWQILKYNDAESKDTLNPGDPVYLKPKRGRPAEEFHIAAEGESLWQISQKYGVKLKKLIKINQFEESIVIRPGQKILLR